MQLVVLQEDLKKALDIISRFISLKPQLPILSNVLLKTTQGKLFISGTNLEVGITTIIGASVKKEGNITTPFRIFQELVSSLTTGRIEIKEIKEEKEALVITSNNYSINLTTLPPNDFPEVTTSIPKENIKIKTKLIDQITQKITFATGNNEIKAVYSGVLFNPKEKGGDIVATDGVRLSRKIVKELNFQEKVIIPARVISELCRIFSDEDEISVSYKQKENQVIFGGRKTVLTSHTIEEDFPDFEKVIPSSFQTIITFEKEEFLKALTVASIFAEDYKVTFEVSRSGIKITSQHPQFGGQNSTIEAKVEGEEFLVAFNWRFLREFLNSVGGDSVILKLTGPSSPAVFLDSQDPDFTHVIMPIRITTEPEPA